MHYLHKRFQVNNNNNNNILGKTADQSGILIEMAIEMTTIIQAI